MTPFPNARILHTDGLMIEGSVEAAKQARPRGIKVVMDAGTMRDGSLELASMVDILIASERFVKPLIGNKASLDIALKKLYKLGPEAVIITLGSRGSMGMSGDEINFQRAFPVDPVDTTGAGDVYHGSYIYGMLQGWDMKECMRFASAASAIKCGKIGARKGIASLQQVRELMSKEQ